VTACDGATIKPVILRDADGSTITVTTPGELQSGSWRLVVDDNSTTDDGFSPEPIISDSSLGWRNS
jgi:hypothetical protein